MSDVPFLGREFAGFKITGMLGKGGMGVVLKAVRESDGAVAAVKIIKEAESRDPQFVARFEREASVLQSLAHPNILSVYANGRTPDGTYYIAMEFVDGSSAGDVMKRLGRIPPAQAMSIVQQTSKALKSAHEKNVIHRDIKPDNILLTKDGRVKLADFGLAKDTSDNQRLTLTGQILGTPSFMSPEQGQGEKVDHRSDEYSLGATFYAMLAGEKPFTGSTPIEVVVKHIKEEPPALRGKIPGLPDPLYALIRKMMAKDPAQRFQDHQEVVDEIERIARVSGWSLGVSDQPDQDYAPTLVRPDGIAGMVREAARAEVTGATFPVDGAAAGARVDTEEIVGDAQDSKVGQIIGGKYKVRSKLGEGGMGAVYLVRHTDLQQDYALKVLHPAIAANESFRERFLREAKAATSFIHKHAIQIRDFGQDGSSLYMTMDFSRGRTLKALLEKEGRFSEARTARIAQQVLLALREAHSVGLIHRDLKPENLMIEARGGVDFVRILDFGVAKMVGGEEDSPSSTGPTLTRTGTVVGTMQYMSPEQASGDAGLDARSDLYSLAALLYESLAGRRHLEAQNMQKMMFKLATEDPEPLSKHVKVSKKLEKLVMKNLSRDREKRSPDAGAFLAELEACSDVLQSSVSAPRRRFPWAVPAAALGLAAVAALVFLVANPFAGRDAPGPAPSAGGGTAPPSTGTEAKIDRDKENAGTLKLAEEAFAKGDFDGAKSLFSKARDFKDTEEVRGRVKACAFRIETAALEKARAERDYGKALDHAMKVRENAPTGSEQLAAEKAEAELKGLLLQAENLLAEARRADEAGNLLQALPLFSRYADEFPRGPSTAAASERAAALGKALEAFQGLLVHTEPPGAQVLLDDRLAGRTPLSVETLPPGEHALLLELEGYLPRERKVTYEGRKLEVRETLEKEAFGSIRVKASGPAVQIAFQGIPRGAPPLAIERVPPGDYALEVTGPGNVAYEVPVKVEREKAAQVKVDFDELSAREEKAYRELPRGDTLDRTSELHAGFLAAYPKGRFSSEARAVLGELDTARKAFEGLKALDDPARKLQAAEDFLKAWQGKTYPLRWHVEEAEAVRDTLRSSMEKDAYDRIAKEADFFGRRRVAQEFLDRVPWSSRADEVRALSQALVQEEKAYEDYRRAAEFGEKIRRGRAYLERYPQGLKAAEVTGEAEAAGKEEAEAWAAVEAEKDLSRRADLATQYAARFAGIPRADEARKAAEENRAEAKAFQDTARSADACQKYLDAWPAGSFRTEAANRLGGFGWPEDKGHAGFAGTLPEGIRRGETPGEYASRWDGAAMVYVPEGFFPFGTDDFYAGDDEGPEVMTWVSGFFLDKEEVTNRRYGDFLAWWKGAKDRRRFSHPDEPAGFDPTPASWTASGSTRPDHPAVGVAWFGAWAYARWAGKCLPTEAQWEKAASSLPSQRAKRKYPWGDEAPTSALSNFDGRENGLVVSSRYVQGASPFGALNMAGNAREWCLDAWNPDFLETLSEDLKKRNERWAINPCAEGPANGSHAVRGGHWDDSEDDLAATRRLGAEGPDDKTGFRCSFWHVKRE